MKYLLIAAIAFGAAVLTTPSYVSSAPAITQINELSHGGGCRKSSPPGRCCHMKRATGVVHCH
ncbi:MAG: hypothetical protein AAFN79_18510 [Pseudomonadota bacterium]